jgi:hypothetical protein
MRNAFVLFFAVFCLTAKAQDSAVKFPNTDASPVDIAYFPLNAAKVKKDDPTKPIVKVVYSRPAKKGREIFGGLEPFDKVWRVGANESTEIRFYKDVTIGDKKIKAGIYSLFAIPNKDKWSFIINSDVDKWGAYNYDQTKDIVRVEVPTKTLPTTVEALAITFAKTDTGANLVLGWDNTLVELPIAFK